MVKLNDIRWYFLFAVCCAAGCSGGQKKNEFTYYRAIHNRDTAYLSIHIGGGDFYGKYGLVKGWEVPVVGDITGEIRADTLVGTFSYTPHQHRNKKRVAFALLQRDNQLLLGGGAEISYMGIPHYAPGTLYFDDTGFVFEQVAKPLIFE
ncbi:hypothetical protein [Parapedobacter lycopersici]|uniref:hypothetical protein n=1 Tax=Parapedobacter lycopersici TaxID=1864939 RepID=UPI003342C562